jgi:hypothetical protein
VYRWIVSLLSEVKRVNKQYRQADVLILAASSSEVVYQCDFVVFHLLLFSKFFAIFSNHNISLKFIGIIMISLASFFFFVLIIHQSIL